MVLTSHELKICVSDFERLLYYLDIEFWYPSGFIRLAFTLIYSGRLTSVAGAVIQAIGRLEFEDGLWTGVHLEDGWSTRRPA